MPSSVERILDRLRGIRFSAPVEYESDIHVAISEALQGFDVRHEVQLSPRNRIDFVVDGVGIEVKKGKPNSRRLAAQVERYAMSDAVNAVVIVSERNVWNVPHVVAGKPVYYVPLSGNWGVAL